MDDKAWLVGLRVVAAVPRLRTTGTLTHPTVAANKAGKPAHDLAVFVTLEEAEQEVARLRSIGYPHELMILTAPVP